MTLCVYLTVCVHGVCNLPFISLYPRQNVFLLVYWSFLLVKQWVQSINKKYLTVYWSNQCFFQTKLWDIQQESAILARACGVSVGRRSGGRLATTLVATKNDILFSFFSFFPFFFLRRLLFSLKERSDWKTYLEKVDGRAPKPRGRPLSRPRRPFWGPLARGAALQAVSECPRRR